MSVEFEWNKWVHVSSAVPKEERGAAASALREALPLLFFFFFKDSFSPLHTAGLYRMR